MGPLKPMQSLRVFDNFMPDPDSLRTLGLNAAYIDWEGHDGEVYKRVCLTEIPGLQDRIEAECGPVDMLGMGFRLNFDGELPNAAIHTDLGWGTHALVLYLSDGPSGTAFWCHKKTGATFYPLGDIALLQYIKDDWDNEAAWSQVDFVPMQFNRALIYDSSLFHSRYPFEAFGAGFDDGRLIAVAFFTPLNT